MSSGVSAASASAGAGAGVSAGAAAGASARGRGGRGGRFRRGGRGLGGRGRGGFGLLHRHPDLGRDALEQAAGRELQHFVADAQVVAVDAQRAAGGLDSLLHGLGGHFDLTHGDFLPYLPRWGLSLFRRGPGPAFCACFRLTFCGGLSRRPSRPRWPLSRPGSAAWCGRPHIWRRPVRAPGPCASC